MFKYINMQIGKDVDFVVNLMWILHMADCVWDQKKLLKGP